MQKQKIKKDKHVDVKMSPTFISIRQDHTCQLPLPQAYQLLHKVLEDIVSSEQKHKMAYTAHQRLRSANLNKPTHTETCDSNPESYKWPKIWEPKASLHIQVPASKSSLAKYKQISLLADSKCQTHSRLLPPLQQIRQVTTTGNPKQKSIISETSKTIKVVIKGIPKKLLSISNLKKIDIFPIVSS